MQINIALTDNNSEQAEVLRRQWFPSASSQQIRDSFIFNEVIDRFQGDPVEVLADYFRSDDDSRTAQRRITLRQDTNERLRTIASVANKPIAATLRALIAYAVDNLAVTDAAKELIIDRGFDPVYGARPLRRYLQSSLETLVAKKIISGDIAEDYTITVDAEIGELVCR